MEGLGFVKSVIYRNTTEHIIVEHVKGKSLPQLYFQNVAVVRQPACDENVMRLTAKFLRL
jgi:hypothetical protein